MKKLSIIAAAIIAGTLSASAFAYDGEVKFTGNITDEACTVTNAPATPLAVVLGEVAKSSFGATAGTTASTTKFTLALTNCPDTVNKARVKFDGAPDATNPALLRLDAASVATGVGIEILDDTGTPFSVNTASKEYPLVTGNNSLNFAARYKSTLDTVTVGSANANTGFTINYN
ncbi:fimbrial protein [Klebsiella oxytoca]|uniref:fimbrial protein n=1 Tax=Klebsiella oxytoca TaxID=571 RepID=UPI00157B00EE|nr:fimbrial protein [Klebsiella oxytoca]